MEPRVGHPQHLPDASVSHDRLGAAPTRTRSPEKIASRQLIDAGDGGIRPLKLTDPEVLLLPLLATDDSVPDIARNLHVSVNTVRKQVATLRGKFRADTRAELVRKASAYGAIL